MNFLSNPSSFVLLLLLPIASFSVSFAQPFYDCGITGNYTGNSTFAANLSTLISTIASDAQLTLAGDHFYNLTAGQVTLAGLCRGDLAPSDCHSCFSDAAEETRQACPTQNEAIGWYRDCMLRYAGRPFLGTMESSPKHTVASPSNASDPVGFNRQLTALLGTLRAKAVAGGRLKWAYGSRRVNTSRSGYAVLQCTPDLNASDCTKCVDDMISYIPACCYGKIGGAILTPNCALRFDVYQFYHASNKSLSPPSLPLTRKGNSKRKRKSLLQLSILIGAPTTILLVIGIWNFHRRRKAMQTANKEIEDIIAVESLQFDLTTIKVATHNFSSDNKLGEGGFGEVYKGKLGNGQQIAVKRLSKNSGQGITEFKTEVVLVAKLQHKNLVKLLGFCLALKEKILVYEFLSNSSLDRFLFDPTKSTLLNWDIRFKIIFGIARGLLYLHEDSRLKVIHRDLKSSNILLDEEMNPKISDFGLAKLFGVDETQGNTKRIVGTYGYMAPEYAITGHYSVKSDVFSFGVIVLEIISGQKNRYFARPQTEEALLHRAWRLWNEDRVLDIVDPTLGNNFPMEELTKCIHIGLLSIQEDPVERPRMTSIVAALNGDSISLPEPKPPQFFGNARGVTTTRCNNENPKALGINIEELEALNSYSGTENITNLYPR